jgi:hypothetical protein
MEGLGTIAAKHDDCMNCHSHEAGSHTENNEPEPDTGRQVNRDEPANGRNAKAESSNA